MWMKMQNEKCGYTFANDIKFAFWNCKYVHNSFSKPKFKFTCISNNKIWWLIVTLASIFSVIKNRHEIQINYNEYRCDIFKLNSWMRFGMYTKHKCKNTNLVLELQMFVAFEWVNTHFGMQHGRPYFLWGHILKSINLLMGLKELMDRSKMEEVNWKV
jgi:hypothetical protein